MELLRLTALTLSKLKSTVVTRFVSKIPPEQFKKFPSTFWVKIRLLPVKISLLLFIIFTYNFFSVFYVAPAEKPDQIQIEIQDLNSGLKFIKNEQDYMIQRGKVHSQSKKKLLFY